MCNDMMARIDLNLFERAMNMESGVIIAYYEIEGRGSSSFTSYYPWNGEDGFGHYPYVTQLFD